MKLGAKMFFCITVFFSVAFLCGGYILLSYFYEITMEREIETAAEQYQYNKFVVQANLITRGEEWFAGAAGGSGDLSGMISDMSGMVAVFSPDGSALFFGFPEEVELGGLLAEVAQGQVSYRFIGIRDRTYLLTAGVVSHGDAGVYLVTGADVESVLEQQERIIAKFGAVYGVTIGVGSLLIFGLSILLTKPVKELTEATRKIADGNYKERVAEVGRDEVGQLARNFNRMAGAVEEKVRELSDSARRKEDFVADFAHELKTPLTSIIGYANRIYQRELAREEQKQAAWYIWNEGMRLESLAWKLMDLTALEHGDFPLQETDAEELFRELAADVEYLMAEKGVTLRCTMEQAYIDVEYDLFQTLFLNLIDNAVKAGATQIRVSGRIGREEAFGADGGEWDDGSASEDTAAEGKAVAGNRRRQDDCVSGRIGEPTGLYYMVQIADNGSGIPPQEIRRITEAFYMVDKSRSRKQHGAGIGLALAEKIARIHGSSLSFESDGKSGTKVSLYLHCKGADDDAEE